MSGAAVALSRLGSRGVVWLAIAPAVARVRREPVLPIVVATAVTTGSADLLALVLREVVGRPRPCNRFSRTAIPCPATPSFPSDHAAMAAAGAGFLARTEPRMAPVLVPLAAAVAYSRKQLAVHYTSDVIGGFALGGACACLGTWLDRRLRG